MDLPPYAESVWGEDVTAEADGTFSVMVFYLDGQKITGLPSKRLAIEVCYALSQAYDAGSNAYAMSCN